MGDFIYRYCGYCFWKIIIAITAIRFPGENKFSGLKQKHEFCINKIHKQTLKLVYNDILNSGFHKQLVRDQYTRIH